MPGEEVAGLGQASPDILQWRVALEVGPKPSISQVCAVPPAWVCLLSPCSCWPGICLSEQLWTIVCHQPVCVSSDLPCVHLCEWVHLGLSAVPKVSEIAPSECGSWWAQADGGLAANDPLWTFYHWGKCYCGGVVAWHGWLTGERFILVLSFFPCGICL